MRLSRLESRTVAALLVLGLAGLCRAQDRPTRGKQLEFDPGQGEFVEAAPPEAGTGGGDLALARQAFGRGDHNAAYRSVKRWLKEYGEQHELATEAKLLRGEVQIARKNYYKAHQILEPLMLDYAGTALGDRAAELEFVIAEVFLSGTRRKVWGIRMLKATDLGIEILDRISAEFPDTTLAENAIKTKADYYFFTSKEFELAELEYARLAQEFPRSRYARYAMRQSAEAALASFSGIEFDDAPLIEAEERFEQYLAQYGEAAEQEGIGQILQQIHAQRAAKEFSIGRYYERTNRPAAAAFYYYSTMDNWPDTVAAAEAQQRLAVLVVPAAEPELPPEPEEAAESDKEIDS